MRAFVTLLTAGMIFAGGLASGEDKPKPKEEPKATSPDENRFKALDKDSDGKVSKDEFLLTFKEKAIKERQAIIFTRFDKDKDGFLTMQEFKELYKAQNKR